MLYQMKSLNISKIRNEFLLLTVFHAEQFSKRIQQLEVEDEIKEGFIALVNDFLKDLLEMADIHIEELEGIENYKSILEQASKNCYSNKVPEPSIL